MPTMSNSALIAAAGTVANALTGKVYEFLAGPSLVSFGIVGSALGLTATVKIGNRTLLDNEPVSGANRFPVIPDDIILQAEPGLGGERLTVRIDNPTGGGITYYLRVDVIPL